MNNHIYTDLEVYNFAYISAKKYIYDIHECHL